MVVVVVVVASGVFTVPVKLALSATGGWGWGGGNNDKPNHIPKKPFVLTIPNPKQCNPKALRPHNPKPEAVQSQTSSKAFVFQPEAVQSQTVGK